MKKIEKKLKSYWKKFWKKSKSPLLWVGLSIVCVVAVYLIVVFGYWTYGRDKIYPGVSVAGINLGGKTKSEAAAILDEQIKKYLAGQINFSSEKPVLLPATDFAVSFDTEKTISDAIRLGNSNPFMLGTKRDISLVAGYDQEKLYAQINKISAGSQTVVANSSLVSKDGKLTVTPGKEGKRVNYTTTAASFKQSVSNLVSRVSVATFVVGPTFSEGDLAGREEEIATLSGSALTLTTAGGKFEVTPDRILGWVRLSPSLPMGDVRYGDIYLTALDSADSSIISSELVSNYLLEIAPKINQTAVNAQLSISGARATVFALSRDGRELDVTASASKIVDALDAGQATVELVVTVKKAEINETSLDEMGITELVSTGYSSFTGSPTNRKHNIRVGSSRFNGVLIKPDQAFSFNTALGPVDASTGYLPELVIKENKTIPEYGGGMCQVSSTAFRAALNAGLPILERTPHSYPVSYYKPYGVDATVYLPHPDLVFKNDTGHYILIQTRIEGTKLFFDFYGTKPARTIKFAGNADANGAVFPVEQVSPAVYDQGARGNNSFTAAIWRFIYDSAGKLVTKSTWVSKYDTPDNYPH